MKPLLLIFALYLLLTGHQAPGGGFVAGLVAAAAFVFHALAYDVVSARRQLRVEPHFLIGAGLFLAAGSGFFQIFKGVPFMTSVWIKKTIWTGMTVELGTPTLFDLGVCLVVLGASLLIFFNLKED
jgi:multicomponent Na+:H+ antiporter subunit B